MVLTDEDLYPLYAAYDPWTSLSPPPRGVYQVPQQPLFYLKLLLLVCSVTLVVVIGLVLPDWVQHTRTSEESSGNSLPMPSTQMPNYSDGQQRWHTLLRYMPFHPHLWSKRAGAGAEGPPV
jgi:hypothetical protein